MTYILVAIFGLALLLTFIRLVNELFNYKLLKHQLFQFPNRKAARIGFYLCAIAVLAFAILNRLELWGF